MTDRIVTQPGPTRTLLVIGFVAAVFSALAFLLTWHPVLALAAVGVAFVVAVIVEIESDSAPRMEDSR